MDSPGSPLTWMTAVVGIIKYDHPSSSKQPKVRCCSLRPQSCVISASQPWACYRAHDRVVSAVSNRSIFVLEIQKGVSFQFFPLASWDCPPTPPPHPEDSWRSRETAVSLELAPPRWPVNAHIILSLHVPRTTILLYLG